MAKHKIIYPICFGMDVHRDLVRGSFIPPEDIRQLCDLCRYWCKLTSCNTDEKSCPELFNRVKS